MDTQVKEKSKAGSWKAFFRTIKKLRLPWVWIIVGLSLNLGLNDLLLKLPDTTADLLSGVDKSHYVLCGVWRAVGVGGCRSGAGTVVRCETGAPGAVEQDAGHADGVF